MADEEQLTYVIVELPDEVTLEKGPLPPGVTLEVRARALRRLRAAVSDTCALTQGLDTAAPVLVISDGSGEAASARQEYRGTFETALGTHLVFEQPVSAAAAGAEADPVADTSGAHEVTAGANDKASVVPEKAGEKRPRSSDAPTRSGPDPTLLCLVTKTLRFEHAASPTV